MNTGTKPLRRSDGLIKLSRDHHFSLLFGWKIRQGLKNNTTPARIVPYVHYFWQHHILPHFKEEEEILFSLVFDPLVMSAKQDHAAIRELIEKLPTGPDTHTAEALRRLADTLDQHIRFEERELFPCLENILKPAELERIGQQLKEVSGPEKKDSYADEFWNLKSSL